MVFESVLNPLFKPLLTLEPILSIFIIALFLTLLSTVAYKFLTDQKRIKELRAEMKKYQDKIKKVTKTDPEKAMKIQKEMMSKNAELMKHSMKPTLYTFLPLIIIFGWLNGHMAYESLHPGEAFTVVVELQEEATGNLVLDIQPSEGMAISKEDTLEKAVVDGKATWILKGEVGVYQLKFTYDDGVSISKDIEITQEPGTYEIPEQKFSEEPFKKISIGNKKIHPLQGAPIIGGFGWLATYITFSIALSFGLRKIMGVA